MRSFLGGVLGKVPGPSPAMVVALLALLVACSGAAVAAIPGQDGTISACRNEHNGALRVIDAQEGQTCRVSEAQLSWKAGSGPGDTEEFFDCTLGEIRLFADQKTGNTFELAEGQLLQIEENEALYSLIGTTFGGDGTSTFALPDLTADAPAENTFYAICVEGFYPEEPSQ